MLNIFFLLRDLFFTCFTSFYYLVIHNILFHYIYAFIWISCAPLIILDYLYVSRVKHSSFLLRELLVTFVNYDKKGEKLWRLNFFFKILHVKGRNTCLCKGEMCFILLRGMLTSFFLYTGLVTMFRYIVLIFDIYMMMYCLLHLTLHVLFLFYL